MFLNAVLDPQAGVQRFQNYEGFMFFFPLDLPVQEEDFLLAQHLSSIIWCEINSTTRYEHTPSQRNLSQDSLRRDRLDQHGPANWLNHQDRQTSQPAGPAWTSQNRRRRLAGPGWQLAGQAAAGRLVRPAGWTGRTGWPAGLDWSRISGLGQTDRT